MYKEKQKIFLFSVLVFYHSGRDNTSLLFIIHICVSIGKRVDKCINPK